jgi:hypothetical protein
MRTTINLPEREYVALKALADRREISFTQALRQSIKTELTIQGYVDNGSSLLVEPEEGERERLVFHHAAP